MSGYPSGRASLFEAGDNIELLRSDGTWTPSTILEIREDKILCSTDRADGAHKIIPKQDAATCVRLTRNVFVSCQHSAKCKEVMDDILGGPATSVKTSTPPFNVRDALKITAPRFATDQVDYNVAVFGVKMPALVHSTFEHPAISKMAVEKGIPISEYAMDTFVQKKMPKALDLFTAAQEMKLDSGDLTALRKYKNFCEEFQSLDGSKMNLEAWQKFISKHNPKGWEENLRFDEVLVKNFCFSKDTSDKLRTMTKQVEEKGEMTEVNYEQHSLRWLTKAYKAYGPVGCQTDVINLAFAMMKVEPPKEADESEALEVFQKFKDKLVNKDVKDMWIPTHLIHDGEIDDALTWLVLEYVHSLQGTNLKVIIQMPQDDSCEQVCKFLESHPTKPRAFRDSDSGNAKNFVKPWEKLANGGEASTLNSAFEVARIFMCHAAPVP